MTGMRHPCILPVYQAAFDHRFYWIVSAYMAGGTIGDTLARKERLSLEPAIAIINNVLHALEYAHFRGIIHRDIKPANILIDTQHHHAVLADFGIMKLTTSNPGITLQGKMLGTVDYIAPEQAKGKLVDARADLYSVGAVFYHLLTGRPPFEGDSELDVARQHVKAPLVFPDDCALADPVRALIFKAMAKNPDERWQSAIAMRHALKSLIGKEPA